MSQQVNLKNTRKKRVNTGEGRCKCIAKAYSGRKYPDYQRKTQVSAYNECILLAVICFYSLEVGRGKRIEQTLLRSKNDC